MIDGIKKLKLQVRQHQEQLNASIEAVETTGEAEFHRKRILELQKEIRLLEDAK